jgi:hypothetical protein
MRKQTKAKKRPKVKGRGGKQFDDTNRVSIFVNDRKEDNAKAPDYSGPLDIEGEKYRISLWAVEKAKRGPGKPVMRGQIEPADADKRGKRGEPPQGAPRSAPAAKPGAGDEFGDDLPF